MHESKQVVITGVSRGLGRALVDELVKSGVIVIGCARNETAISQLQREYPDCHFAVVDVSSRDEVDQWANSSLKRLGPPDLLLNNAAVIPQNAPLWDVPPDEFEQAMQVNITGVYNVIRAFLPSMIKRKEGIVVNFSSTWGRTVAPDVAPYCATKWAIEGMTRALAAELPSTMAAIPFNPGVIQTDMLDSCLGTTSKLYPKPEQWSVAAAKFLLELDPAQSGEPLTAPRV